MIPTNYLRFAGFWDGDKRVRLLQQWWYDEPADAKAHGTTRVMGKRNDIEPEHGYGEWRTVPTVEGE